MPWSASPPTVMPLSMGGEESRQHPERLAGQCRAPCRTDGYTLRLGCARPASRRAATQAAGRLSAQVRAERLPPALFLGDLF
jgi:hypothetical protein